MTEYVRMRAMTLQVKVASNGYDEVDYFSHQDDISSTAVAKTPRPGTSFNKQNDKFQRTPVNKRVCTTAVTRIGVGAFTARAQSAKTALRTGSRASRAATSLVGGPALNAPVSLRFFSKEEKTFFPAAKSLFEYVFYCEEDIRKARINDQMGNSALAVKDYRMVAIQDPSNMEAVANIAMYNFYNDQPEIAMRYYRLSTFQQIQYRKPIFGSTLRMWHCLLVT
ncbi:unnamed protein product, partial [Iphiclides podalirius]